MVRVALLALLAVLAVGCQSSAPQTTESDESLLNAQSGSEGDSGSPLESAPSDGDAEVAGGGRFAVSAADWRICYDGAVECATVEVPIDHDSPDGSTISLALARVPATGDPSEVAGTIFVNPGGPGGSGVEYVVNGFRFEADVAARFHLVGFDPRGIGQSSPVACRLDRDQGPLVDHSPDSPEEVAALDDQALALAQTCAAADNPDGDGLGLLAHVDTTAVAKDLDLLRQAVGDTELHYYGFSYGTLIGLVYADMFPDRVGHLGLDGVVDPRLSLPGLLDQQAAAFEVAFATMDAACDDGLSCPDGGVAAAHDRLVRRLEADGPQGQFGQTEAEMAAVVVLYNQALWPGYAAALSDADRTGETGALEQLSDFFLSSISFTAYAAVVCIDNPRPGDPAEWESFARTMAADHPRFGAVIANELRVCAHWPQAAGAPRDAVAAIGAAPALVIGNTNDPATPLINAKEVAAALDNAGLVIVEANGHTAYRTSGCVRELVTDYFLNDVLPAETVRC